MKIAFLLKKSHKYRNLNSFVQERITGMKNSANLFYREETEKEKFKSD